MALGIINKDIITLIDEKKYKNIIEIIQLMQPFDIAALFEDLQEKYALILFRIIPKDLAADTFIEMDTDQQELLISSFTDSELQDVVNKLYIDDIVDILEEMPANVVKRILKNSNSHTRMTINEILKYPQNSAGSIMTTEFISLRSTMTITDAINQIRKKGMQSETIDICYVTDNVNHLIGTITIKTIILSNEDTKISEVMEQNVIHVNTNDDREEVAYLFLRYDLTVLPVVDNESRLVGIITVDDALDVLQEETTEDIVKMAAITPTQKPYLKNTVFEIWKSRIPWLLFLMLSATFTGMIITRFENALKTYIALTAYIPMLMDTGGNAGSQASVTIIRGLSLDELDFSDILHIIWKEARVAVLCGITLSTFNFLKLLIFDSVGIYVAATVSLTLVLTVLIAKFTGSTLPIIAEKARFDPAVMASPFITTIVDAFSLLVYFKIASLLLGI
jgi:magnesium transporter